MTSLAHYWFWILVMAAVAYWVVDWGLVWDWVGYRKE